MAKQTTLILLQGESSKDFHSPRDILDLWVSISTSQDSLTLFSIYTLSFACSFSRCRVSLFPDKRQLFRDKTLLVRLGKKLLTPKVSFLVPTLERRSGHGKSSCFCTKRGNTPHKSCPKLKLGTTLTLFNYRRTHV